MGVHCASQDVLTTKTVWLVNCPTETLTIETDELLYAAIFVCLLGNGRLWAESQGDGVVQTIPQMLNGDFEAWFTSQFGMGYEAAAMSVGRRKLAVVFDSVIVGTADERAGFAARISAVGGPKAQRRKRREINNRHNTVEWSLAPIAEQWADKLEMDGITLGEPEEV